MSDIEPEEATVATEATEDMGNDAPQAKESGSSTSRGRRTAARKNPIVYAHVLQTYDLGFPRNIYTE